MQIRTCLTNNRICVSIIHCDFDGYFYRKKCVLYTGKYGTVEPCYLELKPISLGFALLFSVITIGYLELSYLKLPISNKEQHPLFLFHRQIYPTISNSQLYVLSKLLLPSRVQDQLGSALYSCQFLCKHRKQTFPTILYSRIVLVNYNVFCTYFFNYKVIFIFLKFAL